jgi:O-antigen ligase
MYRVEVMKSVLEKGTLSFIFACVCVILIPIYIWYIPPFMILWGLSRILECWRRRMYSFRLNSYPVRLFILFIVFYVWQLVGIFYSDNIKTGWNIFFSRLSMFLFPFVLVIPGEMVLKNIKLLLKLFAGSTTIFILCCFAYAFYNSISFQNGVLIYNSQPFEGYLMSYFHGSYFSINQHPSYLSMYVIISVFIAFESWFDRKTGISQRVVWLIVAIFLLISIYFLSSRSGILAIVLLAPFYFLYKLRRKGKGKGLIIALSFSLTIYALFPILRSNERVGIVLNAFSDGSFKLNAVQDERLLIWRCTLRIIRKNLIFGIGTGSVKTELMKEYQRIGNKDLIEKKYNVHNQFLEVFLENGFIGLVFFLAILVYMMTITFYERNLLYGLFLMMMIIFFMFETVLYRLAGVSFFTLFSFLLLHLNSITNISSDGRSSL